MHAIQHSSCLIMSGGHKFHSCMRKWIFCGVEEYKLRGKATPSWDEDPVSHDLFARLSRKRTKKEKSEVYAFIFLYFFWVCTVNVTLLVNGLAPQVVWPLQRWTLNVTFIQSHTDGRGCYDATLVQCLTSGHTDEVGPTGSNFPTQLVSEKLSRQWKGYNFDNVVIIVNLV